MKNFDEAAYQRNFLGPPLSLVCGLESIDDELSVLNSLTTECIDLYALLLRVKVIRPQAPLMHSEEIRALQAERYQLRAKAHDDNTQDCWLAFTAVKNKIKAIINQTRRDFLCRAVSSKRRKKYGKS